MLGKHICSQQRRYRSAKGRHRSTLVSPDQIWGTIALFIAISSILKSILVSRFAKKFSNMSSARHPETDEQIERAIQTLKEYLRAFINNHQSNWDEHLALTEFAFELNNGQKPYLPIDLALQQDITTTIIPTGVPAVDKLLEHICNLARATDNFFFLSGLPRFLGFALGSTFMG